MSAQIDLRKSRPKEYVGKEIFEIHPVILGGSPTDPANKTILSRAQHIDAVRYWNRIVQKARSERTSLGQHTTGELDDKNPTPVLR